MEWVNIVAGPVIGAVIGFCTNYIAVKMLFRPLTPKYLFGHTVPFTPGIIPKRKASLAVAVGHAVGNNLLTTEDLSALFLSDEMELAVVEGIRKGILTERIRTESVEAVLKETFGQEAYEDKKAELADYITRKAVEGIKKIDFGQILSEEGQRIVQNKGGMIAMFLKEGTINEIGQMLGEQIDSYVVAHGEEKLLPLVDQEMNAISANTAIELLGKAGITEEKLTEILRNAYRSFVTSHLSEYLEKIDVAGIVQAKIDAMEATMLEKLVLSVMKKELNAIVNLGGLIGFLLGILNIFL